MGITIRKATPEDACAYAACHITCWQSAYRGLVPDEYLNGLWAEREQRGERLKEALENPGDVEYYCAVLDGSIIGVLTINRADGEIWAIYLLEEHRGRGYGGQMLAFAGAELRRMGHRAISLWVFEENSGARRFYETRGFVLCGEKRENDRYGKPLVQLKYVCNC